MFSKSFVSTLLLFISFTCNCDAFKTLSTIDEYVYEVYEPQDCIPASILFEGMNMYLEAYSYPKLHEGIPLKELKIDESRFRSYDEFIADMFYRDFQSYETPNEVRRHYFQVRCILDNQIVGVCVILEQDQPGFYYTDHIGIHKDFRRLGLACNLIKEVINAFPDFVEISLDTRNFNWPAQALYENTGFKKLDIHPNPAKQTTYIHYVLTK